jgi:DNA mismatch repair protein MSH6
MRLLKVVLPDTCLWTSLREVEGFGYERTIKELKILYREKKKGENGDDESDEEKNQRMEEDGDGEEEDMSFLPDAIREVLESRSSIESLGSMMWYDYSPSPCI